jgi:ESS family glutamate:Na+ symporter
MGGGFWTSLAVPLVMLGKGMMIWFVSIAILVIASACWLRFFNTKKNLKF